MNICKQQLTMIHNTIEGLELAKFNGWIGEEYAEHYYPLLTKLRDIRAAMIREFNLTETERIKYGFTERRWFNE